MALMKGDGGVKKSTKSKKKTRYVFLANKTSKLRPNSRQNYGGKVFFMGREKGVRVRKV